MHFARASLFNRIIIPLFNKGSHHRAYAYLVIKSHQSLSNNARKRLEAVESLEELGAGIMLANHDHNLF
jgi:transcription-repair coupling factor (superfamily II helicase)